MKAASITSPLVEELLSDPRRFKDEGRAYQLLEEYFAGTPVRTLRPLLRHEEPLVRHAAVWIASELGSQACELLDDIVPLAASEDRYQAYHALEVALVCGVGPRADQFLCIARGLESEDPVIRALSMRLMTKADRSQLEAASAGPTLLSEQGMRGLRWLASQESSRAEEIVVMLDSREAVLQRYGAIAMKRCRDASLTLTNRDAVAREPEIAKFLES
jgi:hypothetical protein